MTSRSFLPFVVAVTLAACVQILGDDFEIVTTPDAEGGSGGEGSGGDRGLGTACDDASACDSGFCVDGVCCDEVCDGACQACDLPDDAGLCTGTTGEPCAAVSCTDGVFVGEATCDAGVCPDTSRACLLGVCDGPDACMTVVDVSLGASNTCAAWSDGSLRCWGGGSSHQLGLGDDTLFRNVPTLVPGVSNVVEVGIGFLHSCVRHGDGTVSCWGYSNAGQNGTLMETGNPTVVEEIAGAARLGMGADHSCAILTTGQAMCWGLNAESELGRGGDTPFFTDVPDFVCPVGSSGACPGNPATNIFDIEGGSYHTCLQTTDGDVACWGLSNGGRTGHAVDTDNPTNVVVQGGDVTSLAVGTATSCVSISSGNVQCWGSNAGGELGDPNAGAQSQFPRLVFTNAAGDMTLNGVFGIAASSSTVCGLRIGGDLHCWGANDSGQVGDGTTDTPKTFAVPNVIDAGATVVRIGGGHACALVGTEDLRCWGSNASGQLGNADSSLADQPTPVPVAW